MVASATAAAVFRQLDRVPLPVAARELARAGVPVSPARRAGNVLSRSADSTRQAST